MVASISTALRKSTEPADSAEGKPVFAGAPVSTIVPLPPGTGRVPRVLSIAGSDPSGGAGVQADLKSIAAHGGYGMAAITALTAQNTQGVVAVHVPPADFLRSQLEAISSDITIDAVKIGMLGDTEVIRVVRTWLEDVQPAVVVLDPVMVATSGDRLLQDSAEAALRELLPLAHLITPNLPELAALLGEAEAADWSEALDQGKRLAAACGTTVLVKGGHLAGVECPDALVSNTGQLRQDVVEVPGERFETRNTHGTGCSLSSAMATLQVATADWEAALRLAKQWLGGALAESARLDVGQGNGPIHHFHHVDPPNLRGDFAARLWLESVPDLEAIYRLEFIRGLQSGDLPEHQFAYYLAQDALYLNGYSRVLARAGALAPTEEEQLFWARASQICLEVESELHRSWLSTRTADAGLGPVTKAYVDHLLAASATGSYAVLLAAILPCYWIYAEVGHTLHDAYQRAGAPSSHPYAAWLATYADEAFAAATRQAVLFTDAAARKASAAERAGMLEAFKHSCRYELEFFDAPRLHA